MQSRSIDYRIIIAMISLLVAMGAAIKGFGSFSIYFLGFNNCILPFCYFLLFSKYGYDNTNLRPLIITLVILSIEQLLIIIKWGDGNFLVHHYCGVILAFIFARTIGLRNFFLYYEHSVVLLTIISLFLWTIVLLFPFLHSIIVPFSFPLNQPNTEFSIGIVGLMGITDDGLMRNPGFAYEPGRFASFILMAILMNLYRNQFNLRNKRLWILLVGLLSTQSTTGFISLSVCLLGVLLNSKGKLIKNKWVKLCLIMSFLVFFFVSPLMFEKIGVISDSSLWMNDTKASKSETYVPQRIEGLALELLNIQDSPIVGYGSKIECSYVRRVLFPSLEIYLANGLLQIFATIGIPLALLFYYYLWKSSRMISEMYCVKGKHLFFLLICFLNISYNFLLEPPFLFLSLFSVFCSRGDRFQCKLNTCPKYQ